MNCRSASATFAVAMLALLALAPGASAVTKVITESGTGPGQTRAPQGVAVDFETSRLFVADTQNNRVQIFKADGKFEKEFGSAGELEGQFNQPTSIAVDNDPGGLGSTSKHAVYVVDQSNFRIEKFDAAGNFILAFGGGVNKTTAGNVCTAASGNVCGKGSSGSGEGEFSGSIYVAVGPAGTVYVVDSGSKYRLQKFKPDGTPIAPQKELAGADGTGTTGLAVDSSGDFYVSSFKVNGFFKFDAAGVLVKKVEEAFEEEELDVFGLAIDEGDHLYISSNIGAKVSSIMEFDPAVNRLRRFGYGSFFRRARAVAPTPGKSPTGIYAAEDLSIEEGGKTQGNRVLHLTIPPPGPLVFPQHCTPSSLGNQDATLSAEINPEGKATTYHFEYVTEEDFIANGGSFSGPKPATSTPESGSIGSDFKLHSASASINVIPETKYHCRVVAKNADGETTGEEGEFTALEPLEILDTWTFGVQSEEATLNAEVNPLGIPATGFFEYVDEATYEKDIAELGPEHGFDHALKTAEVKEGGGNAGFGGGETPVKASAKALSLKPATTYRYRIIATDTLIAPKTIHGPTVPFRTYPIADEVLPDERGYELVSPGQKNSAEVAVPEVAGGLFNENRTVRIQAAASSGEAATYTSWTSFGDPEGAPSSSQYLSKRTATGWGTENISPFGFNKDPLEVPYRGFNKDLTFAGLSISEPPLTPDALANFDNLYLRENGSGALQALTIKTPESEPGEGFCTGYAGASADGKRTIFAANAKLGDEAIKGKGFSLYEWSEAEGVKLASVLPNGSPAPPNPETGFGAGGTACTMGQAAVRNAISEDGSTLFWSYGGEYEGAKQPLFARIHGETTETIQLDAKAKAAAPGPPGGGVFNAASGDGSKVFFTAPGRLLTGLPQGPLLYRYDTKTKALISLITGAVAPEVRGVIGASEDGTYLYFAAGGVLSGEEENDAGQKAKAGASNLYLWHEDEGGARTVRFIATLSGLDGKDSSPIPTGFDGQTARVSPDGRHLAFLTVEAKALSGFSSTIAAPPGEEVPKGCQPVRLENKLNGDPRCAEAYLYDADADSLTCASCNPAGSRPLGPAALPSWSNPYEGPRYLSDDGSRLFFETRDVLSAADQNQRRDVYEYEVEGAGSCNASSPDFVAASGGCISLISGGQSEDETYLLDASSTGRDVFFSGRSQLVGWDVNENYDVYDAREGGGFPEPPLIPPICEAEACKPPPVAPPGVAGEATGTFIGPGNPKPKKSKQGKKKGKKQKRQARHQGRAAR